AGPAVWQQAPAWSGPSIRNRPAGIGTIGEESPIARALRHLPPAFVAVERQQRNETSVAVSCLLELAQHARAVRTLDDMVAQLSRARRGQLVVDHPADQGWVAGAAGRQRGDVDLAESQL